MNKVEYINTKVEQLRKRLEISMVDGYRIKDISKSQHLKCHCGSDVWYIPYESLICSNCFCDGYSIDNNLDLKFEIFK